MEQERLAHEKEEKEKAEKAKKMKEQFGDATSQWEKDKTEMQNIAVQDKKQGQEQAPQQNQQNQQPDAGQGGANEPVAVAQ